jgi:CubicO group peptidase (beta-lactamase class C family)
VAAFARPNRIAAVAAAMSPSLRSKSKRFAHVWPCLVALLSFATACAAAETPSADNVYAEIRRDIDAEIAAGRLTGVSVALVAHGRIVWEQGFGWADREAGRKATAHTAFSIASTTKPLTTTAMMTLVADGKLDLDAPANDYLGIHKLRDDAGPAQAVTLRRLASHASGLPTFFIMYPERATAQPPAVDALVRDYGHLVAPAGERYEYSNLGMAIVADIVARRSGQSFGDYLQTHVLTPLGMRDSFFDTDATRRRDGATRYGDDGKPLPFYLTATPGSGEAYASAHDLARFAMLHLKDDLDTAGARILDAARIDALHAPATAIAPGYDYGMGWQIRARPGKPTVLYHGGGQSGVAAEFVLVPDADVACVVLSNRRGDRAFFERVRDRLLRTRMPDWDGIAPPSDPPSRPLSPLAAYQGTWRGTLLAQGREVPVVLDIASASRATLSLGDGPARPVAELGLVDGLLSGDSEGDIGSPDARREGVTRIALNLKLRDGRIDGEIIAWRKTSSNMTMLPHWTVLRKAASDTIPARVE